MMGGNTPASDGSKAFADKKSGVSRELLGRKEGGKGGKERRGR